MYLPTKLTVITYTVHFIDKYILIVFTNYILLRIYYLCINQKQKLILIFYLYLIYSESHKTIFIFILMKYSIFLIVLWLSFIMILKNKIIISFTLLSLLLNRVGKN